VNQTADQVFDAINDPRRWWSENIEGNTTTQGAVFYYHYRDIHRATFKITELVSAKKVVWHVLHNDFNFIQDKTEWNGTDIVFEINKIGDQTEVRFTHVGLVPEYECHAVCTDAWGTYIKHSLFDLITKGKGDPTLKDQKDRSLQLTSLENHPVGVAGAAGDR
jgi:hypothetical protein